MKILVRVWHISTIPGNVYVVLRKKNSEIIYLRLLIEYDAQYEISSDSLRASASLEILLRPSKERQRKQAVAQISLMVIQYEQYMSNFSFTSN